MKKKTEKKLSLGKIKIAGLSKNDQHSIQGGFTKDKPTRVIMCTLPNHTLKHNDLCVTEAC